MELIFRRPQNRAFSSGKSSCEFPEIWRREFREIPGFSTNFQEFPGFLGIFEKLRLSINFRNLLQLERFSIFLHGYASFDFSIFCMVTAFFDFSAWLRDFGNLLQLEQISEILHGYGVFRKKSSPNHSADL